MAIDQFCGDDAGIPTVPIDAFFGSDSVTLNPDADPVKTFLFVDLIFGVDVMSRHEFLIFGRHALERVARSGQSQKLRVLRVELDQDSDELERLIALTQVLRGTHHYPGRGDEPPPVEDVDLRFHEDGSYDVYPTEDDPQLKAARAQDAAWAKQAIVDCRQTTGDPRPVLLMVVLDGPHKYPFADTLLSLLSRPGTPSVAYPPWCGWVLSRNETRGVLVPLVGKEVARWFRKSEWPVSYYSVNLSKERGECAESRFFEDIPVGEK